MSYSIQAAEPDASAGVRGVVTSGAQTFSGLKTFANGAVIADQGGANALRFANAGDFIRWGDAAVGPKLYTSTFLGETALRYEGGPIVLLSAQGFCMGGVNSGFSSAGMTAYAQSYLVDVQQTQATQKLTMIAAKGASAGIVVKVGTSAPAVHADAEILRVGYAMAGSSGADGTALLQVWGDGRCFVNGDLYTGTNLITTVLRGGSMTGNSINLHPSAGIYMLANQSGVVTVDPRLKFAGAQTNPARGYLSFSPQSAQPTGPNEVGDMYVTTAGVLKICTVAGSPGTWVSVGAQV